MAQRSRAIRLRASTLVRRHAYMATSFPAKASSAQASTMARSAPSWSGAIRMRSCSAYQATAWATSPDRSWARASRSPGSSWRTFSSRT